MTQNTVLRKIAALLEAHSDDDLVVDSAGPVFVGDEDIVMDFHTVENGETRMWRIEATAIEDHGLL